VGAGATNPFPSLNEAPAVLYCATFGMAVLRSRDPVLSEKREPIELGVADFWHLDTKAILEPLGYQVPMTPCGAGVAVGRRFPT
jgi:hypothetical protein